MSLLLLLLPLLLLPLLFLQAHGLCEVDSPPDCIAATCLDCSGTPATCDVNTTANTISCSADVSFCRVQNCTPCEICVGSYSLRESWEFFSGCFAFPDAPTCSAGIVLQNCTNSFAVQIENVFSCRCFGENCTANLLETFIETTATPPPTLNTASPTSAATTSNGTEGTTPFPSPSIPTYLIIILVIGLLIVVIVTTIIIFIAYKCHDKLKTVRQQTSNQSGVRNHVFNRTTDWQLLERIGHGRFGTVYRGNYGNEIVAIKVTTSRSSWENERNLYSMESTQHTNILRCISTESSGSGFQIELVTISEYYPLGSLSGYLRTHTVGWDQACCMVLSVARGLAHLHSEWYTNSGGILAEKYAVAHRDVKSANMLVRSESGECVLSDLGFALILDRTFDTKQLANAGQVGTYRYMAPEALDARINLQDLESFKYIDIYAFALVVWEIITRCHVTADEELPAYRFPFEVEAGPRPSLDMMKEVVVTQRLRPSLPTIWCADEHLSSLVAAVTECWDVDPEARPSAANIVHRMEDLCNTHFQLISSGNQSTDASHPHTFTAHRSHSPTERMLDEDEGIEHSQSTPPPFYSPPLLPPATGMIMRPPRYLQSSLPHLITGRGNAPSPHLSTPTPSHPSTTSLDQSTEPPANIAMATTGSDIRPSVSVRNSLILGHHGDSVAPDNSVVAMEMLDLEEGPPPFDDRSCDSLRRSCDPAVAMGDGYHENRVSTFSETIERDSIFSNESEMQTHSDSRIPRSHSDSDSQFNSDSGVPHSQSASAHSSVEFETPFETAFLPFNQSKLTTVVAMPTSHFDDMFENSEGSVSTVTNENTKQ